MLPNSQHRGSVLPRSHKDIERKAFERVTKRVLPASHKQLQRALSAEARSYSASVQELDRRGRDTSAAGAGVDDQAGDHDVSLMGDAD